eukprot:CAMPEP_0119113964 /NCGR_PEP_ID=MMETSP1180-20130426/45759_1 /TAXON_ID=3052 ORGANISM="Chlamydomonas cf sp, Strain CCMP681" /NCGR_SAMPLE_ID=MMETSP1180 /ASSEMBLY_ACC=CAM_ASM_000741 /LENGTH=81 /DNA_ID=CAMNT_0007102285 /DNA_START=77 /DNA_END=318 /DNA_ORIENTATION=+
MYDLDDVDFVGGPAKGLTIIITGPTSGIGKETAAAMARRGAHVVLACRNVAKGNDFKAELVSSCKGQGLGQRLEVRELDLA